MSKFETLNDYQGHAMRTHSPGSMRLASYALGVAGEAGEVAELVKKHIGHGHDLDRDKMLKELGDVLWYVTGLATLMGFTLAEVAQANIEKLLKRYPDGFSNEASRGRAPSE